MAKSGRTHAADLVTTATEFADLKHVLGLAPQLPKAAFPEQHARRFKIFDDAGGRKTPDSPLNRPIRYSAKDAKLLSEWYRSRPEPKAEDDGLDGSDDRRPLADVSFRGFRPNHLGFLPVPPLALIDPRFRRLVESREEQFLAKRLQLPNAPMSFYPWCTIGKIFRCDPPYREEFFTATGFMFGGRVMITARHVFPDNIHDTFATGTRWRFAPGYDATSATPEPFGTASLDTVRGKKDNSSWGWNTANGWDYAICRLGDRIGDLSGSMGVTCYGKSGSYKKHHYYSAGYPDFNSNKQVWELGIDIRDVDGGPYERELETYNFASYGWSGGPLFGYLNDNSEARVVGVCSGAETLDSLLPPYNQGVWAGGQRLVDLANYAVANWWD